MLHHSHREDPEPQDISLKVEGGAPPLKEGSEYDPATLDTKEAYFFMRQLDALKHLALTKEELEPLEDFYLKEARAQLADMQNPAAIELLRNKIKEFEENRRVH